MFGLAGVGKGVDEVGVAVYTAAVLRRAGAGAVQTDGVASAGLGGRQLLQPDLVFPAVAEVVLVPEGSAFLSGEIAQGGATFVLQWEVEVGDAVVAAGVDEHVQV